MTQPELTLTAAEPWTVSSLAQAIKRALEGGFRDVAVRGELGRVTKHSSGHIYFDLKDADAVIHAAWFKGAQRGSSTAIEQGLDVVVRGRISTYPARSEYQLIVTSVEMAGVGALLKLIEDRKKKLAAEGLFDEQRKKPLPFLPKTIGIITSPTGAVIHDMIHRLQDRFLPHVLLWPVVVQGDEAAAQVCAAIEGFDSLPEGGTIPRPDVLIIARGGGSVEDLMPFNDETLVRTVAACKIPVISAIGHETDWTLIDLAADVRAPTPTGAAEFAVPVKAQLESRTAELAHRLGQAPRQRLQLMRQRIDAARRGLGRPESVIEQLAQRLDDRSTRLARGLLGWVHTKTARLAALRLTSPQLTLVRLQEHHRQQAQRLLQASQQLLQQKKQKLELARRELEAYSYRRTLDRGFAALMTEDGRALTRLATLPDRFILELADGRQTVKKDT